MSYRQTVGRWGENIAADYLEKSGYHIIGRNTHMARGELDLVAQKDNLVIFVEVKTRTSSDYGFPEDAITPKKKKHLYEAAQLYLNNSLPDFNGDWRIDVVAVTKRPGQKEAEIVIFENVLSQY